MIKEMVKKPLRFIRDKVLDRRARMYLKENTEKKHSANKRMKVGFIVYEPETWDKLRPVYNELKKNDMIIVKIIIVPSFDQEFKLVTHYGKEVEYFRNVDSECILAFEDGKWIDIENEEYDYIFYQDPYNSHMPPTLRSDNVVRFAKICYLPYGMNGSNTFISNNTNKPFFRNVYCVFVAVPKFKKILSEMYKRNVDDGYQHFLSFGYPALMSFSNYEYRTEMNRILWTPRWSYDPIIGGSHFMEYKDDFLRLAREHDSLHCKIRPHPLMFTYFAKEGIISEQDQIDYRAQAKKCGVEISEQNDLGSDFYSTDILITDFSTIIPHFFVTQRPVIYCASQIELNSFYSLMAKGMYIAHNWNEVLGYVKKITEGNDYLYPERKKIVQKLAEEHLGAEKRIVDFLIEDYRNSTE